jgi:O-antigen/teichoic acid export membrane protein
LINDASVPDSDAYDTLRRKAVRGGSLYLLARLGLQVMQWGLTLLVARLLNPSDYGLMATAGLYVGLADLLVEAGLGRAIIYRKAISQSDLAQVFTISLAFAAVLYAVIFFISDSIAEHMAHPEFATLLRALGLVIWLMPVLVVTTAQVERALDLGKQAMIYTVFTFVQAATVLALAAAGFGVWALAFGFLAARVVQCSLFLYATRWRPALAWPNREALSLLRYGVNVSSASMLWFIFSSSDTAVIAGLLGSTALGYYAIAFQLVSIPLQKISANVNQFAFAAYCRLQDDPERMRNWYSRQLTLQAAITFPAITGLALVGNDIVTLVLGTKWQPAVLLLQLVSPSSVLMVISASMASLLNALGRPDVNVKYNAACAIIMPLAFLAGAASFGLIGICLAWLIAYPLIVAGYIHFSRRITGLALKDFFTMLLPIFSGVACMTVVVLLVRWALAGDDPSLVRLCVSVVCGGLTYLGWNLVFARKTVVANILLFVREFRGGSRSAPTPG